MFENVAKVMLQSSRDVTLVGLSPQNVNVTVGESFVMVTIVLIE